jgi:hypothetical protein
MLQLSPHILLNSIKEGIALFNTFSGDTHFLSEPHHFILESIAHNPIPQEQLLINYCTKYNSVDETINEQLNLFIAEAINSGIIIQSTGH